MVKCICGIISFFPVYYIRMACSLTMDGMLERDKLVTKQTLKNANAGQVTEEQRRQNQLLDTALQMQQNNQQQQENRYTWWGLFTWKDGEEMTGGSWAGERARR